MDCIMKITYLSHSGFLVELQHSYLLFDYYRGEIPELNKSKVLYIFVSHKHEDHYSFSIWNLKDEYPKVKYILSKDVPFTENVRKKRGLTDDILPHTLRVNGNNHYSFDELEISTLKSTDAGVAFLVETEGVKIYHSGDLNLWAWKDADEEYNRKMRQLYCMQIDKMKDEIPDVAFFPLDSRQEEYAYEGLDYFRKMVDARHIFPMHTWGKYEIISLYKKERKETPNIEKVYEIKKEGESFQIL